MDVTRLPEPITMSASMAILAMSPKTLNICVAIAETVLSDDDVPEGMQEHVDALVNTFMQQTPPMFDGPFGENMSKEEATKLAYGIVGIGGIVSIHEEVQEAIYACIDSVVDGTKVAMENFGNFIADNE